MRRGEERFRQKLAEHTAGFRGFFAYERPEYIFRQKRSSQNWEQ